MQSTEIIEQFDCKYLLGLTATPYRRDGLGKLMQWHIGPITGWVDKKEMPINSNQCQAVFISTGLTPSVDPSKKYDLMLTAMTHNWDRNHLICRTLKSHNSTGITLVLSERQNHCESLARILYLEHGIQAAVLTGKTPAKERDRIIEDLRYGRCNYLLVTGQLIDGGFDLPEIGTLALATPVRLSSRLIKYQAGTAACTREV
jgi:superfamily II DNA or RNA helicase